MKFVHGKKIVKIILFCITVVTFILTLSMDTESANPTVVKQNKILCMILTAPKNHQIKAIHLKNTWGKRCDKLLFMSSESDETLPAINLGVDGSREKLWGKTKAAWKYVYYNYFNEYSWFFKADDDTYAIVENLRYMLRAYDTDEDSIFFGCKYKKYFSPGYMSGGGGYVLSRKALKLLIEKSLSNSSLCREDDNTAAEDLEIGKCLNNVGVMAGDSRDNFKRGKFFPYPPAFHLVPGMIPKKSWFWEHIFYPTDNGPECCSNLAVAFHYVDAEYMYELEYLIYRLHPYGIQYADPYFPEFPPDRGSIPKRIGKML